MTTNTLTYTDRLKEILIEAEPSDAGGSFLRLIRIGRRRRMSDGSEQMVWQTEAVTDGEGGNALQAAMMLADMLADDHAAVFRDAFVAVTTARGL